MQRGLCFDHNEICDLIRERALSEINEKIRKDFLWVSISLYNNEMTAVVTHIDRVSSLSLKED